MRDTWTLRSVDCGPGELADFDDLISSAVARCLKDENRLEIAGDLSIVFGEEISVHMLNAYASEARREHRIPASRFLALIGLTRRFDILDAVLREVGAKAIDRHDVKRFRIGTDYVNYIQARRFLGESVAEVFEPFEAEPEKNGD